MAVESAADRAEFVSTDEFGETATYTLAAGGTSSVDGIFYEPVAEGVGMNPSLATTRPTFQCRTADLPSGAKAGDTLAVSGRTFRVLDVPDQADMTVIALG